MTDHGEGKRQPESSPAGAPGARAFHATVVGEVQGVGFRWSALREATALGLAGWVRNSESGAVEAWAEGEAAALGDFLEWLHRGPSAAFVRDVTVTWQAPRGYAGFTVAR